MTDINERVTRGSGLMEPMLARLRARTANNLLPGDIRDGRILDIGCGSYPYFLSHTYFKEKYAIDQFRKPKTAENINWHSLDLNRLPELPFQESYFNAVTMLAVAEHLDPAILVKLLMEIHRILSPKGILIITTPAAWSDPLLKTMARLRLVSQEEIDDHVFVYTLPLLGWYFGRAGFNMNNLDFGYFEFGLNMWATAIR